MRDEKEKANTPAPRKSRFGDSYLEMKRNCTPYGSPVTTRINNGDRFIPSRFHLDRPVVSDNHRATFMSFNITDKAIQKSEPYLNSLKDSMFGQTPTKLMDFHPPKPRHDSTMMPAVTPVKTPRRTRIEKRDRPRDPHRILDAPGLIDDFYLNLLAWSSDNIVAVALENSVYLGNMSTDVVACLCKIQENHYVSSLEWIGSQFLAVGVSYGKIKIFDITTKNCVRNFQCHLKRVSSLNWSETNFLAHSHEACQVSWSPDGKMLASGGNDDVVRIWDVTKWESPRYTFSDHKAAVKAIAWNPHDHSMIVTGGGSTDKSIKFWNARVGIVKKSVLTSAQVCSLVWNPHQPELLSGHGYGGNKLCLWTFPSVVCVQEFPLRSDVRPLNMSLCPEGSQVCVANSDETLKFWAMFTPHNTKNADELTLPESYAKSFGEALPMSHTFWEGHQIR